MGLTLIVDDDPAVRASLALLLRQSGRQSLAARDPEEALRLLLQHDFELVIEDMNFSRETSGREGLALLREMRALRPRVPVVLLTAWASIELAVEGMKAGASDFVTKPWSNAALLSTIATTLGLERAQRDDHGLCRQREELDRLHDFAAILGHDEKLLRVLELVSRVAGTDASVLITGESGTGKELIAAALHKNSRRRGQPFVKVNLGGISSTLFESEMFGHVRGAFTDARDDRDGRFAVADGGTIFLDEIGELEMTAQVKLLRVLQDRTYEPLGASRSRVVDVRVISATNRPLEAAVAEGRFREDLLYRLNLISIHLPPLRDRPDDIALLAESFAKALGLRHRDAEVELDDSARNWLRGRLWPGNVRELRQTIERAVLVGDRDRLSADDFLHTSGSPPQAGSHTLRTATLDDIERETIRDSLRTHDGNLTRVAEALGLSRGTLYRRLGKHGLK